jgi:hypothetical protein
LCHAEPKISKRTKYGLQDSLKPDGRLISQKLFYRKIFQQNKCTEKLAELTSFADIINSRQHLILNLRVFIGYLLALLNEVFCGFLYCCTQYVSFFGAAFLLARRSFLINKCGYLKEKVISCNI